MVQVSNGSGDVQQQQRPNYIRDLRLPRSAENQLRQYMRRMNTQGAPGSGIIGSRYIGNELNVPPPPLTDGNIVGTERWGNAYLISFEGNRSILFNVPENQNQPVQFQLGRWRNIPMSSVGQ